MDPVMKRELQPVHGFGGAKIGFNAQDRFMMALGRKLVVVTSAGDAYGAEVTGHALLAVVQLNAPASPSRLQFRLRYFIERDSNDRLAQGANDEVYLSALGTDSSAVVVGENGQPVAETIVAGAIGDVSADPIRNAWRTIPYVLMEFDLRRLSDWPRSFVVTLLLIEEDDGDLAEAVAKLEKEVGETIRKAAEAAATAAAGALVGAAVGSVIPGIGTAVGAAVGALSGAAYDLIIKEIKEGLANDAFTPRPIELVVENLGQLAHHPAIGIPQFLNVKELDADYTLEYDWVLVA
jgi:hypothetical protein